MSIGTVAVRGVLGPLMVGHGTQKLFGWFGGHGLEGTAGYFESLGLRPGRRNAIASGAAEAVGGALLTLGALTPLAASMICGSMATAIRKVHARNGPWITEQGYEYNVVIIAAMAVLAEHGPGRPSVDARLFPKFHGPAWALAAVGAGVAGSYLVDVLAEPAPEEPVVGAPAQTDEARFTKEAAEARSES